MLTLVTQATHFKLLPVALAHDKPDTLLPLLRQFWRDIDGLAKEKYAVWEVYRRKRAIQQDAGDFFL
jgi:hypothetical protein